MSLKIDDTNSIKSSNLLQSDRFSYYKTKQSVRVDLYKNCLKLYNLKSSQTQNDSSIPDLILSMNDIAGSSIGKGHSKHDMNSYLTIYSYVKINKRNDLKRKRTTIELSCSKFTTYDENLSYVNNWHRHLDRVLRSNINLSDLNEPSLVKPFLVLVNPHAGAGKAKNIYFERVLPVFAEANIPDTVVFTQHSNYAKEFVKTLKLDDYRGILVISGDGLVYEIINGLMERPDWQTAIKTPLGHIPGGSANALSCCVAHLSNEVYKNLSMESFATQTAFNLTKSRVCPLDLVAYELCNKKVIHSFLSLEWAIIADVDLESEKYRFLGGLRFAVGALKRILKLRIYRGRLSFLPAEESKNYTPKNPSILITKNNQELLPREETPNKYNFKHLNPIDKPVPNDWLTIEDNFVMLLVVYLPLISPDFLATNESTFNDGNMHIVFIKEGISKAQMLQLFTDTENGNYLQSEHVEYVKVKAFRLEPLKQQKTNPNGQSPSSDDGAIMVDGERVPYGVIQAEIIPSLGNILANLK